MIELIDINPEGNEANIGAMKLWNKVCEKYSPCKIHLNELEIVISFFVILYNKLITNYIRTTKYMRVLKWYI